MVTPKFATVSVTQLLLLLHSYGCYEWYLNVDCLVDS